MVPFLLNGTIETHTERLINDNIDIEILKRFLRDLYVDDSTTSLDDESSALEFYQKTKLHMAKAGFDLCKWRSNNTNLQEHFDRESSTATSECNKIEHLPNIRKVLGLNWDSVDDSFVIDFEVTFHVWNYFLVCC